MASLHSLISIFTELGCKIRRRGNDQLMVSCPLARWRHENGDDSTPSLSVRAGEPAICYCFGCKFSGTVRRLLYEYANLAGVSPHYLLSKLDEDFSSLGRSDSRGKQKQRWYKWGWKGYQDMNEQPDIMQGGLSHQLAQIYESYRVNLEPVREYLKLRGLKPELADEFKMGYDEGRRRLLIPCYDWAGRLVGIIGRLTVNQSDGSPKYLYSKGFELSQYLFGENIIYRFIQQGRLPSSLVLVEGVFDHLNLYQYGVPALALMGSNLSSMQRQKLSQMASHIILMLDNDKAGIEAANRIYQQLHWRVRTSIYSLANMKVNDPAELTAEQVAHLKHELAL